MITTVFFDLGNVILPFDLLRLARRLAHYSSLTPEEIREKIWDFDVAEAFECGRMTPLEFFDHVKKNCRIQNLTFDEFIPIFNDIFEEDTEIVLLIQTLKPRYKLGLLSNTNAIHVDYIRQTYDHLGNFDRILFSNEAGVRKPDPAFYKIALESFAIQPHESVFIDDNEANIFSARKLGIHGIRYKDIDQLKAELHEIGVNL